MSKVTLTASVDIVMEIDGEYSDADTLHALVSDLPIEKLRRMIESAIALPANGGDGIPLDDNESAGVSDILDIFVATVDVNLEPGTVRAY